MSKQVQFRSVDAAGARVFYREAGPADGPVVLLWHGFPTSSHMYRELIPRLADRYRVIAPDLPGFGFTTVPEGYRYTFASLAATAEAFVEALGLRRYAIYVFDYGAPVGLRLALAHPERVAAVISQNGNAYVEGLSEAWNPIQRYWQEPNEANRAALEGFLAPEATRWQYEHGVADPTQVAPEAWTLDAALLARPGVREAQLDLFLDYATNVALYPQFQAFLRESGVPVLAAWGKNDPFFLPAGAEAYRRDQPEAEVILFDTGHFALETHAAEIAEAVRATLAKARF